MKKKQGFAREIIIIGSTGFRSFVEPEGDLHEAVQNCGEAKIILLDPLKYGVIERARSIAALEITAEVIREQIIKSIDFLKSMKAARKNVRLKLCSEMPLLKMAILGDCAFIRHYHTGPNPRFTPEFTFKNERSRENLYLPMYHYFCARWQDPSLPEYDLDNDELVYRNQTGSEMLRAAFNDVTMTCDASYTKYGEMASQYALR